MPREAARQDKALNAGQVRMNIALTIGASGAVSSFKGAGLADASPPVRASAGTYTITLDRQYAGGLVGFGGGFKRAAGATLQPTITSGDGSSSAVLTVQTQVAAGTATDPSSGDVVYLEFVFDEQGVMR